MWHERTVAAGRQEVEGRVDKESRDEMIRLQTLLLLLSCCMSMLQSK